MKWTCLGMTGIVLALASCDSDMVRYDPHNAPKGDEAGLHVVLDRFTKESSSADIWLKVTNTTASPIALKAPPGSAFWAKAFAGDQEATVAAERWPTDAKPDDQDDTTYDKILGNPYTVKAGVTREIEVHCRLQRPLATSHTPWKLIIYVADRGSIELPVADPQVATTQAPERH